MSHWIILPVVLPALVAPLIVLAMRHDLWLQRVFGLAATAALVMVSGGLLWSASTGGPQVYFLGDWPAPFGIVLVLDRLAAMMVALTSGLALVVQLYVVGTGWDARGRHFHALFLFQLMGLNGAFLTGDAFNLFVFFEVLLIASYGLMIHGGGEARLRAGVQYVAFNLIGSTLFLFALAMVYAVTGTLNIADLAVRVAGLPAGDAALLRVAGVLMLLVFAVKGALVPLQFWLPGTYANAPGPVAALFAVMTKVGAYAVMRVFALAFPTGTPATGTLFADLLMPAALVTIAVGSVGVLGAGTLARQAAFAGIASMGTLFAAVAAFEPQATAAALYYLIHSTLAGAALFLVVDLVTSRRGNGALRGATTPFAQQGLLAALFLVAAVALAGTPPLSGFIGKLLVMDALRGNMAWVWTVILAGSFLMILGFARAGSHVFWKSQASGDGDAAPVRPDVLAHVAVFALVAGLVMLTVFGGQVTAWLDVTARGLHDPAAYIGAVMARAGEG
jgi:multicomponent K+:H+ antiporter subunit D